METRSRLTEDFSVLGGEDERTGRRWCLYAPEVALGEKLIQPSDLFLLAGQVAPVLHGERLGVRVVVAVWIVGEEGEAADITARFVHR